MNKVLLEEKEALYKRTSAALYHIHKGYAVHKIIDVHLRRFIYHDIIDEKDDVFKNFFRAHSFRKFPKVKSKVLVTLHEYMTRKDYQEIFTYVTEQIEEQQSFSLNKLKRRWIINIENVRTGLRLGKKLDFLPKRVQMQTAALITQMLNTIDSAEKQIRANDVQKYVCFCSVSWMENMITQYFNIRNIPTYDLQHGVTRIYHKNTPDNVEYSNIVSTVHFTWGNYSRDEFLKYGFTENSVISGGYPRKHELFPLRKPAGKQVLVFLSRPDFEPENYEVLRILAEFNQAQGNAFRFAFKLHPSLHAEQYQDAFTTTYKEAGFTLLNSQLSLHELFREQEADFCIVVNTSCYYECYMLGVPALRYYSERFDLEHAVTNDLFDNVPDLDKQVQNLYHHFEAQFHQDNINKELDYVLGLDKNEYARVLNG
jgi:hypothetical protein